MPKWWINSPELAKVLDDQDNTRTTTTVSPPKNNKRKSMEDGQSRPQKKKAKPSLFERIAKMGIEEVNEVETITMSNQNDQKWITVNFK